MSEGDEMSREAELNTKATFNNVRIGGPKEKRIRRVELMGEHTLKPLNFVKVEQFLVDPSAAYLSTESIREYFELRYVLINMIHLLLSTVF